MSSVDIDAPMKMRIFVPQSPACSPRRATVFMKGLKKECSSLNWVMLGKARNHSSTAASAVMLEISMELRVCVRAKGD
jgi:hypothetical protein